MTVEYSTPRNINFQKIPLFGLLAAKFDKLVGESGLQEAARRVVKQTRTRFSVEGMDPQLSETLASTPSVIVCNHRFDFESLALFAALPSRDDSQVIASFSQTGIGPNTASHLIPVFISGKHDQGDVKLSMRLTRWLPFHPRISPEDAHQRNIESLEYASRRINEGHQVIMFPSPRGGRTDKWLPGIGHLLKGVKNPAALLIFAHVEGTSDLDVVRLIPGVSKRLPVIKVSFSQPVPIADMNRGVNTKELIEQLEKEYAEWFAKL